MLQGLVSAFGPMEGSLSGTTIADDLMTCFPLNGAIVESASVAEKDLEWWTYAAKPTPQASFSNSGS